MPPVLLDGKAFSKLKLEKLSQSIQAFTSNTGIKPGLAVILVGDDSASQVYVNKKAKTATDLGMISNVIRLPENTSEEQLLAEINQLNLDDNYHGILVQLPLPKHIDTQKIIMSILPEKDVDGFHPTNVGRLSLGLKPFAIPCTPQGVMELLEHHQINLEGQHAVIIGRSNIVGKPMAQLLLSKNATVTIAHSKTKNLQSLCLQADVIVAAVGIAQLVKKSWVKPGAVVVDVGINRTEEGKLVGDVDFKDVLEVTSAITPVPGGVGPMTVACLMSNTFDLCQAKHI